MKAMSFEKNGPKQGKRKSCRGISLSFLRLCAFFLTCVMIPALMVMPAEARTKPGYGSQGNSQSGQSGLPGKDKPGALNGETILENLLTSHSDASDSDTKESTVAEIDTFPENPCITWCVRGIEGRVKSAEVYIGAEQAEVVSDIAAHAAVADSHEPGIGVVKRKGGRRAAADVNVCPADHCDGAFHTFQMFFAYSVIARSAAK